MMSLCLQTGPREEGVMLAQATRRLRAYRLSVEQEYGELGRGKPAWPLIPLYGLEAWRRK